MSDIFQNAILNGLDDVSYAGHETLSPKLLTNNGKEKIWYTIRRELLEAQSFTWVVAFISEDMLTPFKLIMADLAQENKSGTLITSTYLNFNSPRVFYELNKIPNLTVKISLNPGFHAKGYLFNHQSYRTAIIGSANFTRSALLKNYEWALKVSSKENGSLTKKIETEFSSLNSNSQLLSLNWIKEYEKNWQKPTAKAIVQETKRSKVIPNKMQKNALQELEQLVKKGENRALVVSATGTGKTYLGAFAVKEFKPKKFLYLVHREQIAKKACSSFKKVIGTDKKEYGILSGNKHQLGSKYTFATVQTVSQDEMLVQLDPNGFDYILIDEAHRSAAPSYQKILNHFKPKFWLGMTATPERMDNQDVYKIFDYNLAYEIRLQDALQEQMLTPFHYVGVQDYEQDGVVIDETADLKYLANPQRVNYVLKQLDYYGFSGSKPKGLVFCSRKKEADELAKLFSQKGHLAKSLTNEDNESKRQSVVKELETGKIEYIFTVDLFNEGIDIPSLNQIIMLRNTQSSIVFTQQLGRGLRKFPGKSFLTVIDFIGNYKNNYLIPIALNGDKSRDKDLARNEIKLPEVIDVSTINFSKIAGERILASLNQVKLDSMFELRQAYQELKNKLGRVPYLTDFYRYGSIAPNVLIKNKNFDNYGEFLQKMGEDIKLSTYQNQVLSFITQELSLGKRIHELLLLKLLIKNIKISKTEYLDYLIKDNAYVNDKVLASIEKILSLAFFDVKAGKTTKKEQYGGEALIKQDKDFYYLGAKLKKELQDIEFVKILKDALNVGISLNQNYDNQSQFTLYQKYDRKDACRLLNWPLDVSAPMYGYHVGENETPIFITYKKEDSDKRNAIYQNTFEDGQSLRWYTRTPRHLDSDEVQRLLDPKMKLQLFVKRSDAYGKEFYYLGEAQIKKDSVKEEKIGPKKKSAVGMDLVLKTQLAESMYEILLKD